MQDSVEQTSRQAMKSLRTRLRVTQGAIVLERLLRCFWPAVSWALLVLAVVRVGLLSNASPTMLAVILLIAAVCGVYLLLKALRVFRWPSRVDAINRLDETLPGRPLQTLGDHQAVGADDPASIHLWARHLQRMAAAANQSSAAKPDPRLASRDPWALRLMAIFLCASALIFARVDPVQSLVDGLNPQGENIAAGPSFEGWAEPPAYTGKPAIYLNKAGKWALLELPQGTLVTLRIYGGTNSTTLTETVSKFTDTKLPEAETDLAEVSFKINQSGMITLSPSAGDPVKWAITVIPDLPPKVELTDKVTRTIQGALKMPFHATDDYGVIDGTVTIALQLDQVDRRHGLILEPEDRAQVVLDLPLPFNRSTDDFTQTVVEDLAEHPWAGLPVKITLQVQDDAGQSGAIPEITVPMPGKRFFDTLAGAIAEQRRDLLWNRDNAKRVAMILRAITHQPSTIFDEEKAYLVVRSALRRLEINAANGLSDEIRDEVAELLWKAALLIEDGDLSDARARLKRAQDRLSEAMKNGATDEEIAELMEELRKASKQYMRQLAREQRENPKKDELAGEQRGMEVSPDQLQQMLDRIEELMKQGRMDEARELMQQLQQMMENMQVTERGQGTDGEPGEHDMEDMQDTLRQQQDLADETFRKRQEEFNQARRRQMQQQQGQQQQGQNQQGVQPEGDRQGQQQGNQQQGSQQGRKQGEGNNQRQDGQGNQLNDLAERQQALRDLLSERRGQLSTGDPNDENAIQRSLQEAERQMDQAGKSLQQGDTEGALDGQANAMEALRQGMREMEQADSGEGTQQPLGQGQKQGQTAGGRRDPLGRSGNRDALGETNGPLSVEESYRRSREVMDEIRKRSGDRTRPMLELDYLKRLLDRF